MTRAPSWATACLALLVGMGACKGSGAAGTSSSAPAEAGAASPAAASSADAATPSIPCPPGLDRTKKLAANPTADVPELTHRRFVPRLDAAPISLAADATSLWVAVGKRDEVLPALRFDKTSLARSTTGLRAVQMAIDADYVYGLVPEPADGGRRSYSLGRVSKKNVATVETLARGIADANALLVDDESVFLATGEGAEQHVLAIPKAGGSPRQIFRGDGLSLVGTTADRLYVLSGVSADRLAAAHLARPRPLADRDELLTAEADGSLGCRRRSAPRRCRRWPWARR